jgi:16S rRNA (cytosine967-C5)-methyltransferase
MTPSARLSAAIELLDAILAGEPAERALTRWARASRFAGSKDRAAVRDVVFDCLRQRRSLGWLGGGDTGRALVLAHQVLAGEPVEALFDGQGFGPAPLTAAERAAFSRDLARRRSLCGSIARKSSQGNCAPRSARISGRSCGRCERGRRSIYGSTR